MARANRKPAPRLVEKGKVMVLAGPYTCLGVDRVLGSYKTSKDRMHVAADLQERFGLTEDRKAEMEYVEMSAEERKAAKLADNQTIHAWKNKLSEEAWQITLTKFECTVLKDAMDQYMEWMTSDKKLWEENLTAQLEKSESKEPAPAPTVIPHGEPAEG